MKNYIRLSSALLSVAITSTLSASVIVDFTSTGSTNTVAGSSPAVFSVSEGGISFDITVVGINGSTVTQLNGGLGASSIGGTFLNSGSGVSEEIQFTISNVVGLAVTDSLVISNLLSQNSSNTNATQTTGFSGTFGNAAADSVTLTSDLGTTFQIDQVDTGDTGSILLNTDNNTATTGNTFEHSAGNFAFTTSFSLAQTDTFANQAVLIQGFEFDVVTTAVPEPSTSLLVGLGGITALLGRRKRA